jgi:hypothetical protein
VGNVSYSHWYISNRGWSIPIEGQRAVRLGDADGILKWSSKLVSFESSDECDAQHGEAATATFNPNAATRVNVANATRGPLLLISGAEDNTVPPVLVRSTLNAYRKIALPWRKQLHA